MSRRTKKDIVNDIAEMMGKEPEGKFLSNFMSFRKDFLKLLYEILQSKEFYFVPVDEDERLREQLCEKCIHLRRTEYGMRWCDANVKRIDDYENEDYPGESIPEFEVKRKEHYVDEDSEFKRNDELLQIKEKREYSCSHFEDKNKNKEEKNNSLNNYY